MSKKKILLLSDDLRMHSGVATVSKDIVLGTMDKYDWVQIGGAVKHPEEGKIIDMGESTKKETGVKNAYLKIYPVSGYGNPNLLREVINMEKPDAILHYTDPRFWIWLYGMEHEIRQNIPIFYYNIWDDIPDPQWNANFYRSSDLLMAISKQTYGINKRILSKYDYKDWQITYVPHGISDRRFFQIKDKGDTKFKEFEQKLGLDKYKFKILYSNRNIRRKMPGDTALAYKHMMDKLTPEQRKDCCFVFHSAPVDDNGTDMRALCNSIIPECPVIFTHDVLGRPMNDEEMNFLFNSADVYINLASNEGFGLGSCEALTVGTPIIVNVTGGLQDQCGFKLKGKHLNEDDYLDIHSLHNDKKWENNKDLTWGKWVKPIWPKTRSLQGSVPTPYIFDDRCRWDDAGDRLIEWYNEGSENRKAYGELGREFVLKEEVGMSSKHMASRFIKDMNACMDKFIPKARYTLYDTSVDSTEINKFQNIIP